jgi:hypothetical protein
MAKPIKVRLRMTCRAKNHGCGHWDNVSPQQTKPKITPKIVAIAILLVLSIFPPLLKYHTENFENVNHSYYDAYIALDILFKVNIINYEM